MTKQQAALVIRKEIVSRLSQALGADAPPGRCDDEAEGLLQRYEGTFACERYSETWYDCPTGTARPEDADTPWCRTCLARRSVIEERPSEGEGEE